MQHINPLVRAADEALATATRLARLLGLHWDPSRDGGPEAPSPYQSFLERTKKQYAAEHRENGR
jgi:hypothetical protein